MNCGWHDVCVSPYPDGSGLDWANNSSQGNKIFFRGSFKRSNSPYEASHLRQVAELRQGGSSVCDIFTVRVEEWYGAPADWNYRWAMRYVHANRGGINVLPIPTSGDTTGVWTATWSGNMVDDSQNCPWTGTHVHDNAEINHSYPKAIPGWAENRNPPTPNAIPYAPGGLFPPNGWPNYGWSRYFEWAEAYP